MSGLCHRNITNISPRFHQNITKLSLSCHQYITNMSPKYQQNVSKMSPILHQHFCIFVLWNVPTNLRNDLLNFVAEDVTHFCVGHFPSLQRHHNFLRFLLGPERQCHNSCSKFSTVDPIIASWMDWCVAHRMMYHHVMHHIIVIMTMILREGFKKNMK